MLDIRELTAGIVRMAKLRVDFYARWKVMTVQCDFWYICLIYDGQVVPYCKQEDSGSRLQ
jgi:hypothetical protein